MIISRGEARALGLKRFFSGDECPSGHIDERLVSNGTCLTCGKERNKKIYDKKSAEKRASLPEYVVKRSEAIAAGLNRFYSGVPCINGHTCERRVSDRKCVLCAREKSKKRASKKPDYIKFHIRLWQQKNKEKMRLYANNRRARESFAEGSFSIDDVLSIGEGQAWECLSCSTSIRTKYHIDHIVPLFLGGSNWPSNLQLLCPRCNLRKGHKSPEEWEEYKKGIDL